MSASTKKNKHNQERILFILMGLIIIGLIVSGYFLFVKKIMPEISAVTSANDERPTAGNSQASQEELAAADNEFIPETEARNLRIYFPMRGQDKLNGEVRRVRQQNMLIAQAKQIIESVIEGPRIDKLHYQPLPENTRLRAVFFERGTFIVDMSAEFAELKTYGVAEQVLAQYSIVNSLTELDPNAQVRFLINGSEPQADEGHSDLSQPMTRLESIISG